jgi:hypothetical protein
MFLLQISLFASGGMINHKMKGCQGERERELARISPGQKKALQGEGEKTYPGA